LVCSAAVARADQRYDVRGEDVYSGGSADTPPERVSYVGTERLSITHDGKTVRYDAKATYARDADGLKRDGVARFTQELPPNGPFRDTVDDDPNFLTVLNQPFAVHLDPATLHDLRKLRAPVPFDASSPIGGDAELHGLLRPAPSGQVDGRATVAVRFEADGPMTAPLPARAAATMSGHMQMNGTAYYSLDDAMLLALDVRLTIHAKVRDGATVSAVTVVYRRWIRASGGT
jgi:hypothetical protein